MHIVAAAVGLSALVVESSLAFAIVKYIGAGYLIWLGISTFVSRTMARTPSKSPTSLHRAFRDGFVVNLFNPKTAIFLPGRSCPSLSTRLTAQCIGRS